jgi:hypothetical protein
MTRSRQSLGRRVRGCLLRSHPGVPVGCASATKPASNPLRFTSPEPRELTKRRASCRRRPSSSTRSRRGCGRQRVAAELPPGRYRIPLHDRGSPRRRPSPRWRRTGSTNDRWSRSHSAPAQESWQRSLASSTPSAQATAQWFCAPTRRPVRAGAAGRTRTPAGNPARAAAHPAPRPRRPIAPRPTTARSSAARRPSSPR